MTPKPLQSPALPPPPAPTASRADLDAFLGILPDADGGTFPRGAQQVQDVLVVDLEAAEEQL